MHSIGHAVPKLLSSSEEMLKEAKEWEDLCDDIKIDEEVRQILINNELAAREKEGVKASDSGYASSMR